MATPEGSSQSSVVSSQSATRPCLEVAGITSLSWEDVISTIGTRDADAQSFLADFYARCLEFNASPKR